MTKFLWNTGIRINKVHDFLLSHNELKCEFAVHYFFIKKKNSISTLLPNAMTTFFYYLTLHSQFTKWRFVRGKNTQSHWIVYILQILIPNMNMDSILKFVQRFVWYFNFSFSFKKCYKLGGVLWFWFCHNISVCQSCLLFWIQRHTF